MKEDAVFCKACVLFVKEDQKKTLGAFVNSGFRKWHKMNESKENHVSKKYHKGAVIDMMSFKAR